MLMVMTDEEKAEAKATGVIPGATCEWPRGPRLGVRAGLAWYLLQIKSGAEPKVADFLRPFGYEVYYPKTTVLRKVPRRELTPSQRKDGAVVRKPRLVPIFPGYPYIRFDLEDSRCHDLFDFAGVYGLHCTGERPVVVDDLFVGHLKALERDGNIPSETTLRDLFGVGDTVRITAGPFRAFSAVIEELPADLQHQIDNGTLNELDDSMCATVGIAIFGRISRAMIPIGSLEKIEQ